MRGTRLINYREKKKKRKNIPGLKNTVYFSEIFKEDSLFRFSIGSKTTSLISIIRWIATSPTHNCLPHFKYEFTKKRDANSKAYLTRANVSTNDERIRGRKKRKKEKERTSIESTRQLFTRCPLAVSTYGRWTRWQIGRNDPFPSIAASEFEIRNRALLIAARRSRTRPAERHEIGLRDDPVTRHKSSRFHVQPLHV